MKISDRSKYNYRAANELGSTNGDFNIIKDKPKKICEAQHYR